MSHKTNPGFVNYIKDTTLEVFGDALPSCIVFDNAMVVAAVKTKLLGFE
jgi:hypothetical protein